MGIQPPHKIAQKSLVIMLAILVSTLITTAVTTTQWDQISERWRTVTGSPPESPDPNTPNIGILARNIGHMTQTSCSGSGVLTGYDREGKTLCWTYEEMRRDMREGVNTNDTPGAVDLCNQDRTNPTQALKGFDTNGAIICRDIYAN